MEKAQLIEKINQVKNINTDYKIIYEVLDELGISYKRTTCHKCRWDLFNIAREELGLLDDASEMSGFNDEFDYIYTFHRPVSWMGKIVKKTSSQELLRDFCTEHPTFCMKQQKIEFK